VDEPVAEVARAIRPFLTGLVPPAQADELDTRIASILNAGSQQEATRELRLLLESHQATSDFMAQVLADAPHFRPLRFQPSRLRDASFQPLPGEPQPVHAGKFGCPQGDYVWYRPAVGVTIPVCPTHGVALVKVQ
jgi:hypothetical protein